MDTLRKKRKTLKALIGWKTTFWGWPYFQDETNVKIGFLRPSAGGEFTVWDEILDYCSHFRIWSFFFGPLCSLLPSASDFGVG